ncbi:MAG: type II/IV secretion system protein [Phycisphaeraceae bacterium]|nr:type II/IV secretion system protein [Phycisphaeraceae bacterium]
MADTLTRPNDSHLLDVAQLSAEATVDKIIGHAVAQGASDLFILSNESFVAIQMRHLGLMCPICIVGPEHGKRCIQHVKANADMEITETRKPHDGRWIYESSDDLSVDLRISIIPTLHGEDLSMRLLMRQSQLFDLDRIGMHDSQHRQFREMLNSPGGLILITGPSGSGKTGTLYAAMRHLNNGSRKINTIEDPIEFAVEGLRQSQVNDAFDLTFADLLRSIVRQNPDVIMVGEVRDRETAEIAVRAANSGHMVFTTLHATVSAAAVQSMLALGVHPHFLSTALRGVVSQRLVRTLCPQCQTEFDISHSPETFDEVHSLLKPGEGRTLYGARGCDQCHKSGYAGRTGVFEVMPVTSSLRALISSGATAAQIRRQSIEEGMIDFRKAAMLHVARGVTSTEEVFRAIPFEHLLQDEN